MVSILVQLNIILGPILKHCCVPEVTTNSFSKIEKLTPGEFSSGYDLHPKHVFQLLSKFVLQYDVFDICVIVFHDFHTYWEYMASRICMHMTGH